MMKTTVNTCTTFGQKLRKGATKLVATVLATATILSVSATTASAAGMDKLTASTASALDSAKAAASVTYANAELAMFPMNVVQITQGMYGSFSHKGSAAIDIVGQKNLTCPVTAKVVKISKSSNTVTLESVNKVLLANGKLDYITMSFTHDNNISDLWVGKVIKQGAVFYQIGTKGYATGPHCHLEVGIGKYSANKQVKNKYGVWKLKSQIEPDDVFFIKDNTKIKNAKNCKFTKVSTFMKAKMTKPAGVKATVKKSGALFWKKSEITFKWNKHSFAQRYEVLVYDKTTKNRSVVKLDGKSIISTTGTSIKYNNKVIKPGRTYEIMVVAICNKNGTEYRSPAAYKTVKA